MIFSWLTSSNAGHFPVAMDKYLLFYMEMMTIVNFWGGNLPPTLYFLFLFSPPRNNCESENSSMEIRAEIAYKSHVSSFPQTVVDLWYTLMPHCYGHTILMIWNHTHTHHQGLLTDSKKGEIETKQNHSWRAPSHVWDASTSVGNLGEAGKKRSRYGGQGEQPW